MTTNMTAKNSVNERAMLVRVSIGLWTAARADNKIAAEVAEKHGSKKEMGQFKKFLIDPTLLQPGQKIAGEARQEHYRLTLPWTDDGFRILSQAGYFTYNEKMKDHDERFWNWFNGEFRPNYAGYVEAAATALNGLFNPLEYPGIAWDRSLRRANVVRAKAIASKFSFRIALQPVPDAADFRVDLGDEETARVKREMTASVQDQIDSAMKDVWGRLHTVVGAMVEKLKAYKVTRSGTEGIFRDTLVSNITDLLEIVPALNLTNDPNIDAFAQQIRVELTEVLGAAPA